MNILSRRDFLSRTSAATAAICLSLGSRTSSAGWQDEFSSRPFVFRGDFPLEKIKPLATDLNQIQKELSRILALPPAQEMIEVYLLKNRSTYREYMKKHFPKVTFRPALFIKAIASNKPGMVFAYNNPDLSIDLRHECTHAMLHAVLPVVPLWLDEGLAEYFEVPQDKRAFDNSHLDALKWSMRLGTIPKLEELENKSSLEEMDLKQYRYAWGWTHFLLHGPKAAHHQLVHFLNDIYHQRPFGTFSARLKKDLPNVEQMFVQHFRSWKK